MIYRCESCGFLFSRIGPIQTCPACERGDIHPATAAEAERFRQQLQEGELAFPERGVS